MSKWGNEDLRKSGLRFLISLNPQSGTIEDFWRWGWCTGRDHRTG